MNKQITRFTPQRPKGVREQITEHLRQVLLSGRMASGERLPTTQELASQWQTHAATVHAALTPLVKQGFLIRTPRAGTFVRKRQRKLTCAGIYYTANVWAEPEGAFQRALFAALTVEMKKAGIDYHLLVDPRSTAEQEKGPWSELLQAADNHKIQALIVPRTDWPHLQWQQKLPVPTAYTRSQHPLTAN